MSLDDDCAFTPGPADITGTPTAPVDARLGPLGANGGPTETVPLLPGSPALDRTPAGTCPRWPSTSAGSIGRRVRRATPAPTSS